ncbi:MAG TPA: hypothetical protein VG406_07285 [Isosphaeraceae bacterium]|nr:hypothetical protein [Isosphaeraceae bacterium]
MFATRLTSLALLVAALGWAPSAFGRDDPKPDDLEKILDKIEGKKADKKDDDKKAEPKKDDAKKDGDKKAESKKDAPKTEEGKVDSKDEDVDDILKGLGGGKDAPATEGPASQPEGPKPKADTAQPKPEDKPIDEELERLQGKIKKKPPQQQGGGGQRQGPLDEVIKKMRDVEKRLGQPDTGEKTREEQQQIVSELDKYLERLRQQRMTSQSRTQRVARGNSPGQNNSNPGNNPGRGDNQTIRPKPPKQKPKGPVLTDKNIWGQLPEMLREEMNNVFKEEPLPEKFEMVRRYYDAVAKKALKKEQ